MATMKGSPNDVKRSSKRNKKCQHSTFKPPETTLCTLCRSWVLCGTAFPGGASNTAIGWSGQRKNKCPEFLFSLIYAISLGFTIKSKWSKYATVESSTKIHQTSSDLLGLIACLEVLSGGFTACLGKIGDLNPCSRRWWPGWFPVWTEETQPWILTGIGALSRLHTSPGTAFCTQRCHFCWDPVSNMIKRVQLHYRSLSSPKQNNPYQAEKRRADRHQGTLLETFWHNQRSYARLEPSGIPGESCQVPKHSWAALQNHVPGNINESCHPSHVLGTTLVVVFSLRDS